MSPDTLVREFQFLACLPQTGQLDEATVAKIRGVQMMARMDVTGEVDEQLLAVYRRINYRRGMV